MSGTFFQPHITFPMWSVEAMKCGIAVFGKQFLQVNSDLIWGKKKSYLFLKNLLKMSAAVHGCLPSVSHSSDLPVAISGSAWEFLLFSYHPLKGFSAHHCVQNRPGGLKNVCGKILWHVPQIKLELQLWLFFPVCSLHNLLLLPAEFTSILSAYLICLFPLSQGCLCFSSCVLHCISYVHCPPFLTALSFPVDWDPLVSSCLFSTSSTVVGNVGSSFHVDLTLWDYSHYFDFPRCSLRMVLTRTTLNVAEGCWHRRKCGAYRGGS